MVWFKHTGCNTPIYEYIGTETLKPQSKVKSSEWRFADGHQAKAYSTEVATCPDCGQAVFPRADKLVEVDHD